MKRIQINVIKLTEVREMDIERLFITFLYERGHSLGATEGMKATRTITYFNILIDYSKMFYKNGAQILITIEPIREEVKENIDGLVWGKVKAMVKTMEDFFKLNFHIWYYVETLFDMEIDLVNNVRKLSPQSIVETLNKAVSIPYAEMKVLWTDEGESEITEYYYIESKLNYRTISEFWIAALMSDEHIGFASVKDVEFYKRKTKRYFDTALLGKCIPNMDRLKTDCDFLAKMDMRVSSSELMNVYEMKDYDECVVFDFNEVYVVKYNCY